MRKRNYVKTVKIARNARRKKILIAVGVIPVLYFLASFILGEMGVVKYYRMKAQYTALTGEIAKLKRDNAKLAKDVHALRSDPAYLERIARDKLGLARQGEMVYYYGESQH
jgi:cell division protein FtsB